MSDGYVELVWGFTLVLCIVVGVWWKLDSMAHKNNELKFSVDERGRRTVVSSKPIDWSYAFKVSTIILSVVIFGVIAGLAAIAFSSVSSGNL
jgi:hypothetical protein